jgi:hypothetical protein
MRFGQLALIAAGLLLGSGCASRPDWIEATLVTVEVSGVWSGDAFVLELTQEGSKPTSQGPCASAATGDDTGACGGPLDRRRLPILATEQPDEG